MEYHIVLGEKRLSPCGSVASLWLSVPLFVKINLFEMNHAQKTLRLSPFASTSASLSTGWR